MDDDPKVQKIESSKTPLNRTTSPLQASADLKQAKSASKLQDPPAQKPQEPPAPKAQPPAPKSQEPPALKPQPQLPTAAPKPFSQEPQVSKVQEQSLKPKPQPQQLPVPKQQPQQLPAPKTQSQQELAAKQQTSASKQTASILKPQPVPQMSQAQAPKSQTSGSKQQSGKSPQRQQPVQPAPGGSNNMPAKVQDSVQLAYEVGKPVLKSGLMILLGILFVLFTFQLLVEIFSSGCMFLKI